MHHIEIDGCWYHAQQYWPDGQDEPSDELVPILEENGDLIPATICICFAHSSSECCCGAWSIRSDWDSYDDF